MATYGFCENKCKHELDTVKVSKTEPTTNDKVWIQKGKNLFNINKLNICAIGNATYSIQNNEMVITSNGTYACIDVLVKLEKGRTYFLSANAINSSVERANISVFSSDYTKTYTEQYVFDTIGTLGISFTPEEENIIIRLYSNANGESATNTVTYSNIQIEQGSTATEYEPYIEKAIYTKNNNGVYEEFYDEADYYTKAKVEEIISSITEVKKTTLTGSDGTNNVKVEVKRNNKVVTVNISTDVKAGSASTYNSLNIDLPDWAKPNQTPSSTIHLCDDSYYTDDDVGNKCRSEVSIWFYANRTLKLAGFFANNLVENDKTIVHTLVYILD
jgi:hypothetical protein